MWLTTRDYQCSWGRRARQVRRAVGRVRLRVLRRLGLVGGGWEDGLPDELKFWHQALKDPGRNWVQSEYDERMNPAFEFQPELRALIEAPPGAMVRILDVGSGPLTRIGKVWPGRQLEIVPVDPLGAEYVELLGRLGIRPPVPPRVAHGERLTESFPRNHFDLAYASNSLDHSYDPLRAIREMFEVVKPGSHVYLWHFAHVGVAEGYTGLHQWNFDLEGGDMVLTDGRKTRHSLAEAFAGRGRLVCEKQAFLGQEVAIAKLQKQGDAVR